MTEATNVVIDYTAIGNAAAEGENQLEMKEGGGKFERELPAEGPAIGRLLQYIELGVQKAKPGSGYKDSEQVMLRFEVSTPRHMIEIEKDGVTSKIPNVIDVRVPKGGLTSKYGRLFTALNCSGKFNHFAQMVGAGSWVFEITHNVSGDTTYANVDKNKAWTFRAATQVDQLTGAATAIPVPELDGTPKVFLYENKGLSDAAYLSVWDTLFIEGEVEAKGKQPAKSKNWIQNTISNSVKFPTSRLSKLLEARGTDGALPDLTGAIEEAEGNVSTGGNVTTASPQSSPTPQEGTVPDSISSGTSPADVDPLLAAL